MELDLRYMEPCLAPNGNYVPSFEKLLRKVPHHHMHAGCPVVALREVTEEKELVLFAYGLIDTNTLHALAFNDVSLEDDEALQQEPHTHTASAIRVKSQSIACYPNVLRRHRTFNSRRFASTAAHTANEQPKLVKWSFTG